MQSEEKTAAPVKSHRWALSLGYALSAASVAWSALAPFLAAGKTISVRSELASYGNAFVVALVGAGLLFFFRKGASKKPLVYVVVAISLLAPVTLRLFSNEVFVYCSAKRTSSADWQKVATVLEKLGKETAGSESVSVEREHLPQILNDAVGLKVDFDSGYMLKRGENSPVEVFLMYGPKSRRWGVVLGNPTLIPNSLKRLQVVAVNPRLMLYVGVD